MTNPIPGLIQTFRKGIEVYYGKLVNVVETKVKASTTAATLVSLVLSYLGVSVFKGDVPSWVDVIVTGAVTGALTFAAGWLAKHEPRVAVQTPVHLDSPSPVVYATGGLTSPMNGTELLPGEIGHLTDDGGTGGAVPPAAGPVS
jgi:hypothetical protein